MSASRQLLHADEHCSRGYDSGDPERLHHVPDLHRKAPQLELVTLAPLPAVIIDLVVNHTSDQHPWFQSARYDPNSEYRDFYVWSETLPENAEGLMAFAYDQHWLSQGWPISCSLPLEEGEEVSPPDPRGHHFFANLLPEGGARERLVRELGVADASPQSLGRLRPGARRRAASGAPSGT